MTTPHEVLSTRALNRAVLARQGLLDRLEGDVVELVERVGFLQAQYAPSMYLGSWSRLTGFERDDLTRALHDRRIVQGTLLRSTIHLVSAADYWPVALAIRAARRAAFERYTKGVPGGAALQAAAAKVRSALAERGTLAQAEIDSLVGRASRAGVGLWIDLVRVPPSGTWERRRANLFGAAEGWLGPPPRSLVDDVHLCTDLLVRRYLTGFGPAAPADVANWAGLPVSTVRRSLDRLPLRHMRIDDGTELVDLADLTVPDGETLAPVRYLPVWDATLLAHCRRTQILPEEHRPKVFSTRTPHSVGTFLVDGRVAGSWTYQHGRVVRQEFTPLSRSIRAALDDEGKRLATFHS